MTAIEYSVAADFTIICVDYHTSYYGLVVMVDCMYMLLHRQLQACASSFHCVAVLIIESSPGSALRVFVSTEGIAEI